MDTTRRVSNCKYRKEGSSFKISQKKYLIDGSTDSSLWSVPLNIRYLDNDKVNKLIMDSDSITIENDGEIPFRYLQLDTLLVVSM